MVRLRSGAAVYVEWNAEFFERLLYQIVVTVYYILRGDSFFLCTNRDGYSVFVLTSDKSYIFFFQSQITHVDICRYIYTGQVTDMYRSVRIRQCRCDGGSLEFLFHWYRVILWFYCLQCAMIRFATCKDNAFRRFQEEMWQEICGKGLFILFRFTSSYFSLSRTWLWPYPEWCLPASPWAHDADCSLRVWHILLSLTGWRISPSDTGRRRGEMLQYTFLRKSHCWGCWSPWIRWCLLT